MNLLIAVCTRQRPRMLHKCLVSILSEIRRAQSGQHGGTFNIELILVENDSQDYSRALIEGLSQEFSFPISYNLETTIGIASARNKALSVIAQSSADWACFIDDDATIGPNWLSDWAEELTLNNASVFQGPIQFQYEAGGAACLQTLISPAKPRGRTLKTAATCNTLFAVSLITQGQLSFNEEFNLTGGEDSEFFYRVADTGAKIVAVDKPKVYEHVPISRQGLRYILRRHFSVGVNQVRINRLRNGWLSSLIRYAPKAIGRMIYTLFVCIPALSLAAITKNEPQKYTQKFVIKAGSAAGLMWGLLGFRAEFYRTVDGS